MNTRKAPYKHPDGTNCWTKNCSLGHSSKPAPDKEEFIKEWFSEATEGSVTTGPVNVNVIAPLEEFEAAAARGELSRQTHPEYPYVIYKYSQITQYSKNWNNLTLASRGLVVNLETGEIVSRPFSKFFNHSENATPPELLKGRMVVSEKLDGSLGISMPTPDGMKITTSGGFSSAQAAHATELYKEKYEGNWKPRKGVTYMWEIIYPENRIVVDYDGEDDIHLLGAVNNRTGKSIPLSELKEWKWKKAKEYTDFQSIDEVVTSPDRSNHEGYIIHYVDTDTRVKYKHDEYLKIHRIATGFTTRKLWDAMRSGVDMESFRMSIPEEYLESVDIERATLQKQFDDRYSNILSQAENVRKAVPNGSQKEIAAWVNTNIPKDERGFVFTVLNNGALEGLSLDNLWKKIRPEATKGFWLAGKG